MDCCICGKSQGRGYVDYPLSEEYQDERVCISCHNKMQVILEAESKECAVREIESFFQYIENGITSPAASEWIRKVIGLLEESPGTSFIRRAQRIQEDREREFEEKKKGIILTTGFSLEGFRITKYLDVIFDEKFIGVGLFKGIASSIDTVFASLTGDEATVASKQLNNVKREAKQSLISKAVGMGANAIIGIDYEGFSIGNIIAVAITGTAVVIKKIAEPEQNQ